MTLLIYVGITIAFLIVVLVFLTRAKSQDSGQGAACKEQAPQFDNERWLSLSECIFSPRDARWLRDELSFPELALSLTRARKQLAIQWLQALQLSFNTLVRTTALSPPQNPDPNSMEDWRMLWLTVRFQFLMSYALMIVKLFGPYHRLIPTFSWIPLLKEGGFHVHRSLVADRNDVK